MDPKKKKNRTPQDYAVNESKALVKSIGPSTPQKASQATQDYPNRFSPLQNTPEVQYKSALVSKPNPQPTNIQIPNSSTQSEKYFTKTWHEDIGMTPHVNFPNEMVQKDFVRNKFPNPSQFWETCDFRKDQKFYELILIDTNSVDLSHNNNKQNIVGFSKCIIKRIHSLATFGGMNEVKKFSVPFPVKSFNYIDYKEAWFRAFLYRPYNHSWFFVFHNNYEKNMPIWIFDWWKKMGGLVSILPPNVRKGFEVFAEMSTLPNYQKSLSFFAEFRVPWIFAWDFHFKKIYSDPIPFSLVRIFKIKWWAKFQEHLASENAVRHFLATGQKIAYQREGSTTVNESAPAAKATVNEKLKEPATSADPFNGNEQMKKEFFEFLAQRSGSTKTRSEESVSSEPARPFPDPIGGQTEDNDDDEEDFFFGY